MNALAFERFMQKAIDDVEFKVADRIKEIVYFIDRKVHERTPVHTGQAVRNMIWSVGSPETTVHPAIESPPDTGRTSGMSLGSEPRRAANEAAARATLYSLDFNKASQVYYLTNNSPDIGLIEDGSSGVAGQSRAPSGVFAITMAEIKTRLASGAPLQ